MKTWKETVIKAHGLEEDKLERKTTMEARKMKKGRVEKLSRKLEKKEGTISSLGEITIVRELINKFRTSLQILTFR